MNAQRQSHSFQSTGVRTKSAPGHVRHVEFALPDEMQGVVGAVETLAICCNIEFDAIAGRLHDARRRLGQLHELWDQALDDSLVQV